MPKSPGITSCQGQSSAAVAAPPQAHDTALEDFGTGILRLKCPRCDSRMIKDEKSIFEQSSKIASAMSCVLSALRANPGGLNYTAIVACCAPCPQCDTTVCMGCGYDHGRLLASLSRWKAPSQFAAVGCCDDGRIIVTWLLSCGFSTTRTGDEESAPPQENSLSNSSPAPGVRLRAPGLGYDDPRSPGHSTQSDSSRIQEKQREREAKDFKLQEYFNALTRALPCFSYFDPFYITPASPFNRRPPPIVSVMLRRSPLLAEIEEMLRNDSIDDILSRKYLYASLWNLLQCLLVHPNMKHVISGRRYHFPPDKMLMQATFPLEMKRKVKDAEPAQPLALLLLSLSKTAERMLQLVTANPLSYATDDSRLMSLMCQQICTLGCLASIPNSHNAGNVFDLPMGGVKLSKSQKKDALVAWHRENAVVGLDDELIILRHLHDSKAAFMVRSHGAKPGRLKRLMSEITTLSSSLPSGIYVRYGSSRLDVMKALIEGPKGTPYEYGLFEFDILCPLAYPQLPPQVLFVSKSPSSINPNLYTDGKGMFFWPRISSQTRKILC